MKAGEIVEAWLTEAFVAKGEFDICSEVAEPVACVVVTATEEDAANRMFAGAAKQIERAG